MSPATRYMRLEVISGNDLGNTITVEDELVIGRHADGPGRLAGDEEISRQHARISREATGDYAIEDLGSSNGTFVNGLRINSPRLLSLGDSIETGATTLVVREIAVPPDAARSSPAGTPRLALSLEVDLDAREARVALADGGEAVRFVFADGAWRAVSS
jgi:pSer/pThr/pTyr-binding forkhead associated (FHA) protein